MEQAVNFENAYREHYLPVYNYIHKHIINEADAEDLTANVFVMAYKAWDRYDPGRCPVRAWFYIIASNLLKNFYRDQEKHKDDRSLDIEDALPSEEPKDTGFEEAQNIMALREVIAEALDILEDREKTIIINKYFRDMTNAELSRSLMISEGNVRVISTRALKKMKSYLEKHPEIMGKG